MVYTIWFIGNNNLDIFAKKLHRIMTDQPVVLLDNEMTKKMLSFDLGYSKYNKEKHVFRVINICYLLLSNKISAIVALDIPVNRIRRYARFLLKNLILVHIKTAETKDIGEADIILDTQQYSVSECFEQLKVFLKEKDVL